MNSKDLIHHGANEKFALIKHFYSFRESKQFLLVPDNQAELLIPILDEPVWVRIIGSTKFSLLKSGAAYFLTPRRRGMEISQASNPHFVLLKINPMLSKVISGRLQEVANGIFECAICTEKIVELRDAVISRDYDAIGGWVNDHLLGSGDEFDINNMIEESIAIIKDQAGDIRVKDLYTNLKISKSKLEKHFNDELRMTPKEFCKIEKINNFINSYQEGYAHSLTELTYKCGYYDQSHLIKDFRYFLDTSPRRFFTNYTM